MARLDIEITDKDRLDAAYSIIENSDYFGKVDVKECYGVGKDNREDSELVSLRIISDELTENECCEIMGLLDDECIVYQAHAGDTMLDSLMGRKYALFCMDDTASNFEKFVMKDCTSTTYPSRQEVKEWCEVRWPVLKKEIKKERKSA